MPRPQANRINKRKKHKFSPRLRPQSFSITHLHDGNCDYAYSEKKKNNYQFPISIIKKKRSKIFACHRRNLIKNVIDWRHLLQQVWLKLILLSARLQFSLLFFFVFGYFLLVFCTPLPPKWDYTKSVFLFIAEGKSFYIIQILPIRSELGIENATDQRHCAVTIYTREYSLVSCPLLFALVGSCSFVRSSP